MTRIWQRLTIWSAGLPREPHLFIAPSYSIFMVTIFLVKHDDTVQGKKTIQYVPQGDSVRRIGDFFQNIPLHKVYTSPEQSTYDTAKRIVGSRGLEVSLIASLTARYFASDTPHSRSTRNNHDEIYTRPPCVESSFAHQERVLDMVYHVAGEHQQETVLMVCDDESNTSILCRLLDIPLLDSRLIRQDPACIHRLEIDPLGQLRGCDINYTQHLR